MVGALFLKTILSFPINFKSSLFEIYSKINEPNQQELESTAIQIGKTAIQLIKFGQNKEAIKKNLRTPEDKSTAWWNEILIYDTKVIDAFVLRRVWDDYYFKNDSYDTTAYK